MFLDGYISNYLKTYAVGGTNTITHNRQQTLDTLYVADLILGALNNFILQGNIIKNIIRTKVYTLLNRETGVMHFLTNIYLLFIVYQD
jgi:hypothetical protein